MNRRLHELELELRRLENEREELAAAYKEAEAVSKNLSSSNNNNNNFYYIKRLKSQKNDILYEKKKLIKFFRVARSRNNVPRDCQQS